MEFACTPSCLPLGTIAITKTGVAMYNPLNDFGNNAVEGDFAEIFDDCKGHTDDSSVYHYHQAPAEGCGVSYTGEVDQFVGVALDGFPIYGPKVSDRDGGLITSEDLDLCNGRMVDGEYRYHLTYDFPYVLGCYWGTQAGENVQQASYSCTNVGTDAAGWGYVCNCRSLSSKNVQASTCDYLTEAQGGVYVTSDSGNDEDVSEMSTSFYTTGAATTPYFTTASFYSTGAATTPYFTTASFYSTAAVTTPYLTTTEAATTEEPTRSPGPKNRNRKMFKTPATELDRSRKAFLRRWVEKLLKETK